MPVLGVVVLTGGVLFAACGGAAAKSAATPTPVATTASGRLGGRFGNRTPSAALQTSIAEGTPPPFRGTPNAARETAIAEGTPAPGFGIRGRLVSELATILNLPAAQLQTELQAPGATIASVGAAHGMARDALRQALIDATRQRVDQLVQTGTITQTQADQNVSQFESNVDAVLDGNGSAGGPPPSPGQ